MARLTLPCTIYNIDTLVHNIDSIFCSRVSNIKFFIIKSIYIFKNKLSNCIKEQNIMEIYIYIIFAYINEHYIIIN